jgi:hypothetical protein
MGLQQLSLTDIVIALDINGPHQSRCMCIVVAHAKSDRERDRRRKNPGAGRCARERGRYVRFLLPLIAGTIDVVKSIDTCTTTACTDGHAYDEMIMLMMHFELF